MAAPIHVANQQKVDLEAKIQDAKVKFTALLDVPLAERTDAQKADIKTAETALRAMAADMADVTAEIARLELAKAEDKNTPIVVGKNRKEDQPVSFGEFLQAAAYNAVPNHRKATILPNGIAEHVDLAMKAAASGAASSNSESGGLLVRNDYTTALLGKVQEAGTLAPKCFSIPVGDGNDGIEAPFIDETSRATGSRWGGVQVYRGAEAAAMTASQPKIGEFRLRLEDMFGLFYATDRVLRDAAQLEALATKAFSSEFAFKLDDEIVRGTGAGQCLGIVGNAPTVSVSKESGQPAATIVYENIIKMHARLLARCMPGAAWFINQMCLPQLNKMYLAVGTGGVPVYLPANGVSGGPYGTLMGLPVNVIEQASALGTVGDIILANFANDYAMISKPMTSASSIHVLFTSNQTTFRWVYPVIGKPTLASAITPYKGSDTLGPFVTLATRS